MLILSHKLILFGPKFFMKVALVWHHLASSSSSFNIQNDVGLHHHWHKSVISHQFKVWWHQAVTSLWRVRTSSNRHFYQSCQWRRPLPTSPYVIKFCSVVLIFANRGNMIQLILSFFLSFLLNLTMFYRYFLFKASIYRQSPIFSLVTKNIF